jgi:hypothetical protein
VATQALREETIADFDNVITNHVARSRDSCAKPECNFGSCGCTGGGDDVTKFFDPHNNFSI